MIFFPTAYSVSILMSFLSFFFFLNNQIRDGLWKGREEHEREVKHFSIL